MLMAVLVDQGRRLAFIKIQKDCDSRVSTTVRASDERQKTPPVEILFRNMDFIRYC